MFISAFAGQRAIADKADRLRAQIAAAPPGSYDQALAYRMLGDHLASEGRINDALEAYTKAIDITRNFVDTRGRLLRFTTQILEARLRRRQGEFGRAKDSYAEIAKSMEPAVRELLKKPSAKWNRSELELGLTYCHALLEAVDFYRELNQNPEANRYLVQLETFTDRVVGPQFAVDKPTNFWPIRIAATYLRGELLRQSLHPEKARSAFEEARALLQRVRNGLPKSEASKLAGELAELELFITLGLALTCYDLAQLDLGPREENYRVAVKSFESALERSKSLPPAERAVLQARCRANLGVILHELAKLQQPPSARLFNQAEEQLRQAVDFYSGTKRSNLPGYVHSLNSLGLLLLETERPDEAKRLAEEAAAALQEMDPPSANLDLRRNTWMLLARCTWDLAGTDQDKRRQAIAFAQEAGQCIQRQTLELIGDPSLRGTSRQRLWGRVDGTIVGWWLKLVRGGENVELTQVLQVFEQTRGQSLLEEIAMSGPLESAATSDTELGRIRAEMIQMQIRLAELSFRRRQSPAKEQPALQKEIEKAEATYLAFLRRLWTSAGGEFAAQSFVESGAYPEQMEKLISWVQTRRLLVLYYLTDVDRSFLLTIHAGPSGPSYLIHQLELSEENVFALTQALKVSQEAATAPGQLTLKKARQILQPSGGLLGLLANPQQNVPGTALRALATTLLPPEVLDKILDTDSYDMLVIVADGPLGMFPFQTLIVPFGPVDKYLLEVANPIVYVPSLTIGERLDRRPLVPVRQALTFAKLVFPEYGPQIHPLFKAGSESRTFSRLCKERGLLVVSRVDESPAAYQATKAELTKLCPDFQIIHLATHGVGGQEFGQWGRCLLLSAPAGKPATEGLLTLPEIYRLPLSPCELVILSACHTHAGVEVEGEGVWGIARGFLVAGARQVLVTLWEVGDKEALALTERLTQELRIPPPHSDSAETSDIRGLDTAAALRKAQLALMRLDDESRKPFSWAPFVLIGAPR